MTIRLVSYNLAGASRSMQTGLARRTNSLAAYVAFLQPDILATQESISVVGLGTNSIDMNQSIGDSAGLPYRHFAPSLTMRRDFSVNNTIMLSALVRGARDWRKGNALLSRLPFESVGSGERARGVVSFPISRVPFYQGDRDSEPRNALLGRFRAGKHFVAVFCVHLSTLRGERGARRSMAVHGNARALRGQQAAAIVSVISAYRDAHRKDRIVVIGDLNESDESAPAMRILEEAALIRCGPSFTRPTHIPHGLVVDHVFADTSTALAINVRVAPDPVGPEPSDHRPIVAEIEL